MKHLFTLALGLIITHSAFADRPHHRPAPNFERISERLQLTADQADSVESIMNEHHTYMQENTERSRESAQQQRAATRERLAGVLDEEQLETFDNMAKKRQARGRRGGDGSRPPKQR
ncbi:MAG: hypothetical protein AB8B48_10840 [Pseudomonadales bacterium]